MDDEFAARPGQGDVQQAQTLTGLLGAPGRHDLVLIDGARPALGGVGGLFALTAAIRNDRRWALVPLAMFGFALTARLATAAGHGFGEVIQPIAVEAAFTALMAVAARVLGRG